LKSRSAVPKKGQGSGPLDQKEKPPKQIGALERKAGNAGKTKTVRIFSGTRKKDGQNQRRGEKKNQEGKEKTQKGFQIGGSIMRHPKVKPLT